MSETMRKLNDGTATIIKDHRDLPLPRMGYPAPEWERVPAFREGDTITYQDDLRRFLSFSVAEVDAIYEDARTPKRAYTKVYLRDRYSSKGRKMRGRNHVIPRPYDEVLALMDDIVFTDPERATLLDGRDGRYQERVK